jgi:hypothetical protein
VEQYAENAPKRLKNIHENMKCWDPSRQFFLWITTTSKKFENWSNWKLEIQKFVNSEGEVIKQGLLCALLQGSHQGVLMGGVAE